MVALTTGVRSRVLVLGRGTIPLTVGLMLSGGGLETVAGKISLADPVGGLHAQVVGAGSAALGGHEQCSLTAATVLEGDGGWEVLCGEG